MKLELSTQLWNSIKSGHKLKMFYYDYSESENISNMVKLPTDFIELENQCLFLVLISFEVYSNQKLQSKTEAFPSNRPYINSGKDVVHTFKYLDETENKVYEGFTLTGKEDEIINYVNNIIMINPLNKNNYEISDVNPSYKSVNFEFKASFAYNYNQEKSKKYLVPTPIIEHFHKLSTVLSGNNTVETKNLMNNFNLSNEVYAGIYEKLKLNRDKIDNYNTNYPEIRCNFSQIKNNITNNYYDSKNHLDKSSIVANNESYSSRFNNSINNNFDTSKFFNFDGTQDISYYYLYTGYEWINMGTTIPVLNIVTSNDYASGNIKLFNENYYICNGKDYYKLSKYIDNSNLKNLGAGIKLPSSNYTTGSYFKLEPKLYNYYQILTIYNLFIDCLLESDMNINTNYLLLFNNT